MAFLEGIGGFLGDTAGWITDLAQDLLPAIGAANQIGGMFGAPFLPGPAGTSQPSPNRPLTNPIAVPQLGPGGGGGGVLSTIENALPLLNPSSPFFPPFMGVGGSQTPSSGGAMPGANIVPVQRPGGVTYPKLVQFQRATPSGNMVVETYVRAPKPRYKVTVSAPRRRCSRPR